MTVLTQLMLISLSVCALGAPLGELHRHRSDRNVYASNYANDYEPFMYAAIPLHSPMPVLHVLSRTPLQPQPDTLHSPSVHYPVYTRPPYLDNEYSSSIRNEYEYSNYGYGEPHTYEEPQRYPSTYEKQYTAPSGSDSQNEVTILYARPNPHGGFLYRRKPNKTIPKRSPISTTESPVIIRVHKYKVVKDLR